MSPGDVVLVNLDPVVGNEQGRVRPALVVSTEGYETLVADRLMILCPITSRARELPHHVPVTLGDTHRLDRPSWVMCEQPRTVSTRRVSRRLGAVVVSDLDRVATVIRRLVHQPAQPPAPPEAAAAPPYDLE